MSIPEAVINEVRVEGENLLHDKSKIAARARRVINALAENLPENAVDAAIKSTPRPIGGTPRQRRRERMRAAIVAALKDIVEGE